MLDMQASDSGSPWSCSHRGVTKRKKKARWRRWIMKIKLAVMATQDLDEGTWIRGIEQRWLAFANVLIH